MNLTGRELWMVVHGLGLGATFLLAYAGGLAGLCSLRPEWVTVVGLQQRSRRLGVSTWIMAIVAWLTVITGTYIVYPWLQDRIGIIGAWRPRPPTARSEG